MTYGGRDSGRFLLRCPPEVVIKPLNDSGRHVHQQLRLLRSVLRARTVNHFGVHPWLSEAASDAPGERAESFSSACYAETGRVASRRLQAATQSGHSGPTCRRKKWVMCRVSGKDKSRHEKRRRSAHVDLLGRSATYRMHTTRGDSK